MTKSEYIEYRLGTKKDVESSRHLSGDAYVNSVLSGMTELELYGTEGAMWHKRHDGTEFTGTETSVMILEKEL